MEHSLKDNKSSVGDMIRLLKNDICTYINKNKMTKEEYPIFMC